MWGLSREDNARRGPLASASAGRSDARGAGAPEPHERRYAPEDRTRPGRIPGLLLDDGTGAHTRRVWEPHAAARGDEHREDRGLHARLDRHGEAYGAGSDADGAPTRGPLESDRAYPALGSGAGSDRRALPERDPRRRLGSRRTPSNADRRVAGAVRGLNMRAGRIGGRYCPARSLSPIPIRGCSRGLDDLSCTPCQ